MTPRPTAARLAGLVLLAVAANVAAPAGWGWAPAVVAWGWAVWRCPVRGDLLDRAVPVVLVGAAALQTWAWFSPSWAPLSQPWVLVAVAAPFVLRPGPTSADRSMTWRTVAYTAAGAVPALMLTSSWLVADTPRRVSLLGWATDYSAHVEILREALAVQGAPGMLQPATGWGGYPAGPHVVWASWLRAAGLGQTPGSSDLVAGYVAGIVVSYAVLGVALAWSVRRALDLLPPPQLRLKDGWGVGCVVVALVAWPFPALLVAGFAPFPMVVGVICAAVGILATREAPVVSGRGRWWPWWAAASGAVVLVAGSFALLLVIPVVAWAVMAWRGREVVGDAELGGVAAVTTVACVPWLWPLVDPADGSITSVGPAPAATVLVVAAAVVGLVAVMARRLAPRAVGVRRRVWYLVSFALLVLGFGAIGGTVTQPGAIMGVPAWVLAPVTAVVLAGWAENSWLRERLRPLRPGVDAALLVAAALVVIGVLFRAGISYYIDKSLFAVLAAILPAAVAMAAGWPVARGLALRRASVVAAVGTALLVVALTVIPRDGPPMTASGNGIRWWWATRADDVRFLVDGPAVVAVASAPGVGAPGADGVVPAPVAFEDFPALDHHGVESWIVSQRWLWTLSGTYRTDADDLATAWWNSSARAGAREDMWGLLNRWSGQRDGRRLRLLVADAGIAAEAERRLVADATEGIDVVVVPLRPGLPFALRLP